MLTHLLSTSLMYLVFKCSSAVLK